MKSGACFLLSVALLSITFSNVFTFTAPRRHYPQRSHLFMTNEIQKVEVCAGKDCKRSGGGPRLEKLIQQVVEEEGLSNTTVERCYCQGECGYGPNILVDDKLINNVRGRDAVLQALGLAQEA
jgi:NADH:ubiquinone oxidoreductase subunit E